jgi:hypothetical protein
MTPQTPPFEHSQNNHAGSGLAVIVLDHLITAEMRSHELWVAIYFLRVSEDLSGRA